MRSQALIRSFLDAISELTQTDSVNLYFPANYTLGLSEQIYRAGNQTLPEFLSGEEWLGSLAPEKLNKLDNRHVFLQGEECGSLLIGLQSSISSWEDMPVTEPSRRSEHSPINTPPICWIGIKYQQHLPDWLEQYCAKPKSSDNERVKLLISMLRLASVQMSQLESDNALLIDPLTCLPSRTKFQSQVAQLCQQHNNVSVLMVHANEFHNINKKYGHEQGDKVIWEISQHLLENIRESDLVSRFGGALFAVGVPYHLQNEVISLGTKIQQALQQPLYLSGELSLGFDIGIGEVSAQEPFASQVERVANVINKADQALKASQIKSMPSVTLWQHEKMDTYNQQADYIGGIFTADTATDYRNMLLLWDISNIIAAQNQFEALLPSVAQRLAQTFDFEFCGIIEVSEQSEFTHHTLFEMNENSDALEVNQLPLSEDTMITRCVEAVANTGQTQQMETASSVAFTAPLDEKGKLCFFLSGNKEQFYISHDSQMLIAALTKQLGRALNRAKLEKQLNAQLEQQKQQLQNELAELKSGLLSSNMFYCSQAMEQLMKQAKRAAMTDTTTLIIGESGTGKERLVHSLHSMGSRRDRPLVVVDCGAIPETLIESELFGHVKGAFTGAQQSSKGRVHEADGGTLMLDEIGELPLQMQTKLLRFVQEKQFTPVGGSKTESVDVKIIAVTNRELEQEVLKGNFRQDLFYRLNVLTLRTPPLRERPDDIPLLAKHFLQRFAKQFGHAPKALSSSALQHMLVYPWPGNIRELENRLMQANLLTDDQTIEWQDFRISHQQPAPLSRSEVTTNSSLLPQTPQPLAEVSTLPEAASEKPTQGQFLQNLKDIFIAQVNSLVGQQDLISIPLGKWLEECTVLMTYQQLDNSVKLTAGRLGISLSTARRKIDKAKGSEQISNVLRQGFTHSMQDCLMLVARGEVNLGQDSMALLQLHLLDALLTLTSLNMTTVAALLGISEPTMYKLKKTLQDKASEESISFSRMKV